MTFQFKFIHEDKCCRGREQEDPEAGGGCLCRRCSGVAAGPPLTAALQQPGQGFCGGAPAPAQAS